MTSHLAGGAEWLHGVGYGNLDEEDEPMTTDPTLEEVLGGRPTGWTCIRCRRKYAGPIEACPWCAVVGTQGAIEHANQGRGDWLHNCAKVLGHRIITPVGAPCVACGAREV